MRHYLLISILKIILGALSAKFWVVLIYLPQEASFLMSLWTAIYFFPLFVVSLAVLVKLLELKMLHSIVLFFRNQKALFGNVALLVLIAIVSYTNYIDDFDTLFAFITNSASFTFSVFVYYLLRGKKA